MVLRLQCDMVRAAHGVVDACSCQVGAKQEHQPTVCAPGTLGCMCSSSRQHVCARCQLFSGSIIVKHAALWDLAAGLGTTPPSSMAAQV